MPWVDSQQSAGFFTIFGEGPVAQTTIVQDSAPIGPTTILAAGNYTTGVVVSDGYRVIAVGITSSQAGALTIQRYLDREGTIPVTAVLSTPVVAATPLVVIVSSTADNIPFASFTVILTNTSGVTATVSKYYVLLQSS